MANTKRKLRGRLSYQTITRLWLDPHRLRSTGRQAIGDQ
jgi:hypothetical protein